MDVKPMNLPFPLGDMPVETFLRDYWQKKPLVIRQAFPDFVSPVAADELAGLACEAEVESRLIAFDPASDSWKMEQGPFAAERFSSLPERNWTLLVQAVDHWVPEAHALLRRFNFIPNWRVDDLMISYAVDGGGVGPHYDNYDVFLIQASGTRRWEFGGLYDEHSPKRDDAPVMILPEWQAEESFDLQPGDMLYLPPRIGHNGIAIGDDCLTCSIGFRAPAIHEMLSGFSDFMGERIGHDERYTDADLTLPSDPGEISAAALEKTRQRLLSLFQDEALFSEWFGRLVTEPKYPELAAEDTDNVSHEDLLAFLDDAGELYQNEGCRLAWSASDKGIRLFADGEHYALSSTPAIALAKHLCHYQPVDASSVDIADVQSLDLLCELLKRGLLYSESAEDDDA
jgi:50S ribosomal protein L16 3-hydroxylase